MILNIKIGGEPPKYYKYNGRYLPSQGDRITVRARIPAPNVHYKVHILYITLDEGEVLFIANKIT